MLYRQGEILRRFLGDESGALDAFLRATDLDPHFAPALVRLADFYWRQGALDDVAEVAIELGDAGFAPAEEDDSLDLQVRLAVATRLVPRDGHPPAPVPPPDQPAGDVARRARVLAEAAGFLGRRPRHELDPVLDALANEGRGDGGGDDVDGAGGPASGFYRALEDLVQEDPANASMGAVRVLGRAAERSGWTAAARGLYSVLVFVDPGDSAVAALEALGPAKTGDAPYLEPGSMLALLAARQPLDALEAIAREDPMSLAAHGDASTRRGAASCCARCRRASWSAPCCRSTISAP